MNLDGEEEKEAKVTFVLQMGPLQHPRRMTDERSTSTPTPTRLLFFHHNRPVVCLPPSAAHFSALPLSSFHFLPVT